MKKLLNILFLLSLFTQAQTALYNSGNIIIHEEGKIGFHTNLINNTPFDENLGLVGFYGNTAIDVSGAFMPIFYDVELANETGVSLNTVLSVANNFNFVLGNIYTPRADQGVFMNFLENSFYNGENNQSAIDGYVTVNNIETFTFPVADDDRLRPLTIISNTVNPLAKCAYFFEDPNIPMFLQNGFNTDALETAFLSVSTQEFWKLEGSQASTATLTWDVLSNTSVLGETLDELTVVGWKKSTNTWVSLGNTNVEGTFESGFITSDTFKPDNYEIITLGGTNSLYETLNIETLDNYFLSPNGDGINDALIIEVLDLSPNNSISIYTRAGLKVFEKTNYTNEFIGISNINNFVINREQGLPKGVYFYVISLNDLKLNYQGFLYLNR